MSRLFCDVEAKPLKPDDGTPEWEDMAKNPFTAQVWMIGVAWEHDEPSVLMGETEADALAALDGYLYGLQDRGVDVLRMRWVAHNVKRYDQPVMWHGAIRSGLTHLADVLRAEKWDKRFVCTMELAGGAYPGARVKLDQLAITHRHKGKGELKEVDFPTLWRSGREGASIAADRCLIDVGLTRWVYGKMTGIEYPEPGE